MTAKLPSVTDMAIVEKGARNLRSRTQLNRMRGMVTNSMYRRWSMGVPSTS